MKDSREGCVNFEGRWRETGNRADRAEPRLMMVAANAIEAGMTLGRKPGQPSARKVSRWAGPFSPAQRCELAGYAAIWRRRSAPNPASVEPNSQRAAGTGTAVTVIVLPLSAKFSVLELNVTL